MPGPKNGIPNKLSVSKNIVGNADSPEEEIDLLDYFRVLWKWKYFIFILTVLPTLIIFLIFNFLPSNYKITYIYDTSFGKDFPKLISREFESKKDSYHLNAQSEQELFELNRRILLDQFYSKENLDKLAAKLRENGFDIYAQGITKSKIQLEISNTLSTLTIISNSKQDVRKISSIVRDDFEKVIPVYTVMEELTSIIAGFKTEMADIKENSFNMELELERKRAILEKMKNLQPFEPDKIPGGIILQIDNISQNSEYLPLAYQVQAIDANIITIEETMIANQKKYNYYKNLISLNEKLLDEAKDQMSSYYTIQEFHSFLTGMMDKCTEKELADYLNAYIKRIENTISTNTPIVEKPSISPISKGIVKQCMVSFVVLLIITSFIAFVLEAAQRRQASAS